MKIRIAVLIAALTLAQVSHSELTGPMIYKEPIQLILNNTTLDPPKGNINSVGWLEEHTVKRLISEVKKAHGVGLCLPRVKILRTDRK